MVFEDPSCAMSIMIFFLLRFVQFPDHAGAHFPCYNTTSSPSAVNASRAASIVLADVVFVSIVVIGRSASFNLHNASESIAVQIRSRPLAYWDM